MTDKKYNTLKEFYPFYLTEHRNTTSRILHFIGTGLFFIFFISAIYKQSWAMMLACPVLGYGFAWIGHFFFEKNRPATFDYPVYSLLSDFRLFFELLSGKQKFQSK